MSKGATAVIGCMLAVLGTFSAALHAAPQTGWWWNPNESGRGFFVESHDGITFIGAYFYDDDGHAKWLVAGGQNGDSYNYSGPLYAPTGGETLFGAYAPPSGPVPAGSVTVHFSDDTHGTLTWPGGTVQIERQIFGTGEPAFEPLAGWWWSPDQPGTGYSVEVQGTNLFVVGFMYEDDGRPVWYFSAGPKTSDTAYHGDVLQFADGQTMGGAYHAPGAPAKVATLDIEFTNVDEATFTVTDLSEAKASRLREKSQKRKKAKRQFFDFPKAYTGRASGYSDVSSSGGHARWEIHLDLATLKADADTEIPPLPVSKNVVEREYVLQPTQYQVTYTSNIGCNGSAAAIFPVPASAVKLTLRSDNTYLLSVNLPGGIVQGQISCPGETPVDVPYTFPGMIFGLPDWKPIESKDLAGKTISKLISFRYDTATGPVAAGGFWEFAPQWK